MLVFYLVDAIINFLLSVACFLRYRQYHVKPYRHISIAALVAGCGSILLAFLGDGFDLINAIFIYLSLIIYMFASLVYVLTMVYLFKTWLQSVQNAPRPRANKVNKTQKILRVLTYLYPAYTLLLIVFFVLLIVTLTWATILAVIIGIVYTITMLFQFSLTVYLWKDIQIVGNESELRKRNQLIRLAVLTFVAAWPPLFSGAGAGIGSSICWWVWFAIVLWPKALCNYEEEPKTVVPGAYRASEDYASPARDADAHYMPATPSK